MTEYISVAEAAMKFGLSERRVQSLCEQGRLSGSKMLSGVWIIPDAVIKPTDARKIPQIESEQLSLLSDETYDDDIISLKEACNLLSISTATGRNWTKLGKVKPKTNDQKKLLFSRKEIENLLHTLTNSTDQSLKRRRNKKQVSGKELYSDYILGKENMKALEVLIKSVPSEFNEKHCRIILANIVLQFDNQKANTKPCHDPNLIVGFHGRNYSPSLPPSIVNNILGGENLDASIIKELGNSLSIEFRYSKTDDLLGLIYMSMRDLKSRKMEGAYYTPSRIVSKFIEILSDNYEIKNMKCIDPCCGSGNFLLGFAEAVGSLENIYGQDIDPLAVALTQANFALKYDIEDELYLNNHFTVGDSLLNFPKQQFDLVIGNPPWGYEFSKQELSTLGERFVTVSKYGTESYDLFVEKALRELPNEGLLAFVLPEAILNVKLHETVRELMLSLGSFSFVSFVGNVFSGVQCPAIILGIRKTKTQKAITVYSDSNKYTVSGTQTFNKESINLRTSDLQKSCLEAIETRSKKVYLKNNAIFALGIVTGDNKTKVLSSKENDTEIVLKGSDIMRYTWRAGNNYIRFQPNLFQQVAKTEYYRAPEKLLYRFICDSPVFSYDDQQTLTLNSCNILIPQIEGLDIKYVMAILNSRVIDFFCKNTFNSIKLLRSSIEKIPIPLPTIEAQKNIIEYATLKLNDKTAGIDIYNNIEEIVMDLYGLTSIEKDLIYSFSKNRNLFL